METETDPREASRRALYERLNTLNKDEFRAAIRNQKDTHLLGDLRYNFNWDPDPRKSTWQAIEINRLLTDIRARREALPQWIGIVVGNLIALAALIVSIIALYKK
jgi:hypothetical protein